jgi:hypothetical protein
MARTVRKLKEMIRACSRGEISARDLDWEAAELAHLKGAGEMRRAYRELDAEAARASLGSKQQAPRPHRAARVRRK